MSRSKGIRLLLWSTIGVLFLFLVFFIPRSESEGWASHFGLMPAALDYTSAKELGVRWERPFFQVFSWDVIEPQPGVVDWSATDDYVRKAQQFDFHLLITIHPFAKWDQKTCHKNRPVVKGFGATMGKPCDMMAYAAFVQTLVERYDGDHKNDMPGLKYPVRYWEIGNEPSLQEGPLIFFEGSPEDYLEMSKATYQAVKKADSRALVVQGGMANTGEVATDFWSPVLTAGGGAFFDVANIHSINCCEDLRLDAFKLFLAKHRVAKPFWITEIQFGEEVAPGATPKEMADVLGRSFIYALANGAEKLFYVQLRMPPGESELGGSAFVESASLVGGEAERLPAYYAYLTILGKLDSFEKVQKIEERVWRGQVEIGKYRFIVDGKPIYALWNEGEKLAASGTARVTDLQGHEQQMVELSKIVLTASPLFVESEVELYPSVVR